GFLSFRAGNWVSARHARCRMHRQGRHNGDRDWMSEQTASSGFSASPRTLELLPRSLPARRSPDSAFALARLTLDVTSFAAAAVIVSSWAGPSGMRPGLLVAIGAAIVVSFTAAGLYLPAPRPKPLA